MRRTLIIGFAIARAALMLAWLVVAVLCLLSTARAASPPLYTYTFAVQAPYDAGSWTIWPGDNHLVSLFGKHFLLHAPQCDAGTWTSVDGVPSPQTTPVLAVNALPADAIAAGVTLKVVTPQDHWDLTTKPLFWACQ